MWGDAYRIITTEILPRFPTTVVAAARAALTREPDRLFLPARTGP
jgi:hypothetical protein